MIAGVEPGSVSAALSMPAPLKRRASAGQTEMSSFKAAGRYAASLANAYIAYVLPCECEVHIAHRKTERSMLSARG